MSENAQVSQNDLQLIGSGTPNAQVPQNNLQLIGSGTPNAQVVQVNLQILWFPILQTTVSFIAS
jgi:hypothetical protein